MTKPTPTPVDQYKVWLWPIVCTAISGCLLYFLVKPQVENYQKVSGEMKTDRETLDKVNKKVATLETLDEAQYKQNVELTLNVLPANKDLVGSISQLQLMSQAHNLKIDDISYASTNTQGSSKKDPVGENALIQFSVSGNLADFTKFVEDLKNARLVMKFDDIDLANTTDQTLYNAEFGLRAYFQPLPNSIDNKSENVPLVDQGDKDLLSKLTELVSKFPLVNESTVNPEGTVGKPDPFF